MQVPTPIQELANDSLLEKGIKLYLKRDDLIHPTIQGNKFRKLKYNLEQAKLQGENTLLTFGGAFSNHIHATSAAAKEYGFSSIGIIRGTPPAILNPTLRFAKEKGMQLHYVSRTQFRNKYDPTFLEELKNQFGSFYMIPEGGTNSYALKGCREIIDEMEGQGYNPEFICVSVGTGGTIGGIIQQVAEKFKQTKILGFSSLKGNFLISEVNQLLQKTYHNWNIKNEYHFGGYAKHTPELISFINGFKKEYNIPLDPIYTGKMMYGIFDLIEQGFFPKNASIMAIHTGGLQGIEGFNERYGNVIL